jgi:Protein of unknown function (DUF3356).
MNHQAEVVLFFGDQEYLFRLTVKQIIELEEKCQAAFGVIYHRLMNGIFTVNDVTETIRLGLIGGGLEPIKAAKLTERYGIPLAESHQVARLVIGAVMFGFEKSPLGKDQAATEAAQSATTPPNSSPPPTASDSNPMTLEEFHFGNWLQ